MIPLFQLTARLFSGARPDCDGLDPLTGLPLRDSAERLLERLCKRSPRRGRETVVLAVRIDEPDQTSTRLRPRVWDIATAHAGDAIISCVRSGDLIVRLDGPAFAVIMPRALAGEDTMHEMAKRIQAAIAGTIRIQGARIKVSASIGVCPQTRRPAEDSATLLSAAEAALEEARVHGPSSVRIFTEEMRQRLQSQRQLAETVAAALDSGQIRPWFQPQVSARDGRVAGVEALARWEHPRRGTLLPTDFLDPIEVRGLGPRLFETILRQACAALREWDAAGAAVPRISVNIDPETLRDPLIAERIGWQLDAFELAPDRLAIEVLEDVVALPDGDVTSYNLARIGELGCAIELDDFGTGQASIAGIRRFGVRRIKIDRSFVSGADIDPEQRRMAAAILRMSQTLGVGTVAEGVSSEGERKLLRSLGCDILQGFGIARPMPAAQIASWVAAHHAALGLPPSGLARLEDAVAIGGETA